VTATAGVPDRPMPGYLGWVRAHGTIPVGEARPFITTLGELASVIVGSGSTVLTLRIAHGTTCVAFACAGLMLSLVVAMLIAIAARTRRRRSS
jgi:hypothetical protein